MNSLDASGCALLLLDLQHDFLDQSGRLPIARDQVEPLLAATRQAILDAARQGCLVVKIGNEFRRGDLIRNAVRRHAAIHGATGTAWVPQVDVVDAPYLPKWKPNAFSNPELGRLLDRARVHHVTIAGVYANACVSATATGAIGHDLSASILVPAVGCKSDRTRDKALQRLPPRGIRLVEDLTQSIRVNSAPA